MLLSTVGCLSDSGVDGPPSPSDGAPALSAGGGSIAGRAGGTAPGYRPPVVAPVVDAFRPPPLPFAAGNRGIEYDTTPGTAVGAIAAGRVVFAGPVAGALHVTVRHGDGLRSSYSYLASIAVALGDEVGAGQSVGTTTGRLHLGVRAGDAYLDPALLFDRDGVHLVPVV
jgi:murein DD-endopeptidase MepM/ murein hydrolase activator NlpD